MTLPPAVEDFVAPAIGEIERFWPFDAATSASVWGLRGSRGEAVLRLFTNQRWLALEPDLATHEAAVLELVAGHGIRTPELLAVDHDGSVAGVPAILMTMLPGDPVLEPDDLDGWLDAMVGPVLRLAEIDAARLPWSYRPWLEDAVAPPGALAPDVWLEAHELATTWRIPAASTLVHRDYHPGNILWSRSSLSGVVDWVNGCAGALEADVAGCAADIALLAGSDAALAFVARWERSTGRDLDPHWLLISGVEMGGLEVIALAWDALGTHRPAEWYGARLEEFLARTLAAL